MIGLITLVKSKDLLPLSLVKFMLQSHYFDSLFPTSLGTSPMQTRFFALKDCFLSAVPPDAPFVGVSDINQGSFRPVKRQSIQELESRTNKRIKMEVMGFKFWTHQTLVCTCDNAKTNVHMEHICNIHLDDIRWTMDNSQTK